MPQTDAIPPELELTVHEQDRWVVVQVRGELNFQTSQELSSALDSLSGNIERHPCIAVDTSRLQYFDSSAIRCLLVAFKNVQGQGGEFAVVDAGGLARRIERIGLRGILPVLPALPA